MAVLPLRSIRHARFLHHEVPGIVIPDAIMDRMERDGSLVVSGHFPVPGFGRLVRLDGRRYWQAL